MMWSEFGAAEALAVVAAGRGAWSPCGLSMLSSINPLTERARGHRYWLTATWFALGSILGGAVLGGATAVFAVALHPLREQRAMLLAIAVAGALIALAADLRLGGFSLPTHPRQVNERWLDTYRRWIYSAGFGFQLGVGFSTYIMTSATYLFVLLGALSATPAAAFAVAVTFGLVRGLLVLMCARARGPRALRQLHQRLASIEPWSLRAAIGTQGAVALVLAYLWVGGRGVLALTIAFAAVAMIRLRSVHRDTVRA